VTPDMPQVDLARLTFPNATGIREDRDRGLTVTLGGPPCTVIVRVTCKTQGGWTPSVAINGSPVSPPLGAHTSSLGALFAARAFLHGLCNVIKPHKVE